MNSNPVSGRKVVMNSNEVSNDAMGGLADSRNEGTTSEARCIPTRLTTHDSRLTQYPPRSGRSEPRGMAERLEFRYLLRDVAEIRPVGDHKTLLALDGGADPGPKLVGFTLAHDLGGHVPQTG